MLLLREWTRVELKALPSRKGHRDGERVRYEPSPECAEGICENLCRVDGKNNAGLTGREELVACSATAGENETDDPCAERAARDCGVVRVGHAEIRWEMSCHGTRAARCNANSHSAHFGIGTVVTEKRRGELNLGEHLAVLGGIVLESGILEELDSALHDVRREVGV